MDYIALLEKIEGDVAPVLGDLGYDLVEREFVQEAGRWILRLYIERPEGAITLDDCERASRSLEGVLNVEDRVPFRYTLEVSSPGFNRPLRRERDFERFKGAAIELKAKAPIQGRHYFRGILRGLEGKDIVIDDERGCWHVPLGLLKKAKIRQDRR